MKPDIALIIAIIVLVAVAGIGYGLRVRFLKQRKDRLQAIQKAEILKAAELVKAEEQVKPLQEVLPVKTIPTGDPWKVTIVEAGHLSDPIRLVATGSQTMSKPIWVVSRGGDPVRIVKHGTTSDPCRIVAGLENLPAKYLPYVGE